MADKSRLRKRYYNGLQIVEVLNKHGILRLTLGTIVRKENRRTAEKMAEYIDKQDAIDIFKQFKRRKWISMPIERVIEIISVVPYVEAEPVKHGRWLIGVGENGEPIGTYCSECGWSWERNIAAIQLNKVLSRIETPRCPYCGARMDEVEHDRKG